MRDEGFEEHWGGVGPHLLIDAGRYIEHHDGTITTTESPALGAGTYTVTVGDREFLCMRVLDDLGAVSEHNELCEAFVDVGGRTVLYRQYRGRRMPYAGNQDPLERTAGERFPTMPRITIDGCEYVQADCTGNARDVVTAFALGLEATVT